ncbi:MAG: apolipoprotein N-acyltransferase, partial [Nitriliruptoraceae bacterium]
DPVADLAHTVATNLRDDTLAAIGDGPAPDLVVWPESSVDRDPSSGGGAMLAPLVDEVASVAGELIAGTTLDGPSPGQDRYVAASRYVGGFHEVERYVKRRLVPFGEYVPLRPLIGGFPPLEQVPRDAIAGDTPMIMHTTQGARVAVVICFETLFAGIVRGNVLAEDEPAQLVLTLTNDASFRDTGEPAQHLAQSRLRAVETGRWVVHAALSGASAFVDPDGRVHDETQVFTRDTIRRDVPLVEGRTPYLVIGDVVGWTTRIGVLLLAGLVAWGGRAGRSSGGSLSRR